MASDDPEPLPTLEYADRDSDEPAYELRGAVAGFGLWLLGAVLCCASGGVLLPAIFPWGSATFVLVDRWHGPASIAFAFAVSIFQFPVYGWLLGRTHRMSRGERTRRRAVMIAIHIVAAAYVYAWVMF